MKRLVTLVIGITLATSLFTGCSSKEDTSSETSTTSSSESAASSESNPARTIVENALAKHKNLTGYNIAIEFVNILNDELYADQSMVRVVEAQYVKSPTKVDSYLTDILGYLEEPISMRIFVKEDGSGIKSYYDDPSYGWMVEDLYDGDVEMFLLDQTETVESFIQLGTDFKLVNTETVDGKEVNTVEMYGNIDLMKDLMGIPDNSFDAFLNEAGDFYMTVKATEDGFIEFDMQFTDLYGRIADAIENSGIATEEELGFAAIYRINESSYNIKLTDLNAVDSIPDPEGIENSLTFEEVDAIYQERLETGIQAEDIGVLGVDEESAAALEGATISLYDPATGEETILQQGYTIDEDGNEVPLEPGSNDEIDLEAGVTTAD